MTVRSAPWSWPSSGTRCSASGRSSPSSTSTSRSGRSPRTCTTQQHPSPHLSSRNRGSTPPPSSSKEIDMAKTQFNVEQLKAEAVKPLYAVAGATEIAYELARGYTDEPQKDATDAQAKFEARVAELQKDAKALPAKVQTQLEEAVTELTKAYGDLADRGEKLVAAIRKDGVKAVTAVRKAPAKSTVARRQAAKKGAAKKAPASNAAATKAPGNKSKPAAKKATAQGGAKGGATTAKKTAAKKTTATQASAATSASA